MVPMTNTNHVPEGWEAMDAEELAQDITCEHRKCTNPATVVRSGCTFACVTCAENMNSNDAEAAYERFVSDFYGGSGPNPDKQYFDGDR